MKVFGSVVVLLLLSGVVVQGQSAESECKPASDMSFICDIESAEDLVLVPETKWVLASGYSPGGAVYAIETQSRAFHQAYDPAKVAYQSQTYPSCSTPPDANTFVGHGLSIQAGENGHSTLYVVGHGGREAIEVFDVTSAGAVPELTWVGCVMMPEGLDANSVAVMRDGSLRLTVLMHPGYTFAQVFEGVKTGAVYGWSPGDAAIEKIVGSELPGNNGIEVSSSGEELYVVSSGLSTISVFSNTNPARLLRATPRMDFSPDNVHMTAAGLLMTGGPSWVDHNCAAAEDFDLETFASCPRGSVGATFNPVTLKEVQRWSAGANAVFSNSTMALEVGAEIWFGTFSGTRIGIIDTTE
jgi:DNA-binding beta-propeller fold protein YncE